MDKTLLAVGAPLERQVRPVAEVCGPDICQDHAGPVEALSFLPTGTALYDQAGLDEAAAIERDKLRARLMEMHERDNERHNYWHCAVVELFGA